MCYVVILYKVLIFYHLQYYNASESKKKDRFSMQANIEIDTKIIQIRQVQSYL